MSALVLCVQGTASIVRFLLLTMFRVVAESRLPLARLLTYAFVSEVSTTHSSALPLLVCVTLWFARCFLQPMMRALEEDEEEEGEKKKGSDGNEGEGASTQISYSVLVPTEEHKALCAAWEAVCDIGNIFSNELLVRWVRLFLLVGTLAVCSGQAANGCACAGLQESNKAELRAEARNLLHWLWHRMSAEQRDELFRYDTESGALGCKASE